jgi:hypothetical protein
MGERAAAGERFEVDFVDCEGLRHAGDLRACWPERFELAQPVRGFSFRRGQRSFADWWWSSKTGQLVGYESWLARDHAMLFDLASAGTRWCRGNRVPTADRRVDG